MQECKCPLMLEEKLEHSHSFMFPFLLLLGPLFLPVPCSQIVKDRSSNSGTIHTSGVNIYGDL
uniref:Uncharacterized protein n=1 Tax=Setaria italica TaxID=4555 RepID=K3YBI2_SETIT